MGRVHADERAGIRNWMTAIHGADWDEGGRGPRGRAAASQETVKRKKKEIFLNTITEIMDVLADLNGPNLSELPEVK